MFEYYGRVFVARPSLDTNVRYAIAEDMDCWQGNIAEWHPLTNGARQLVRWAQG